MGYDLVRATRRGGVEHQYWKEKVTAKLRSCGYEVQEEYPIGEGKTVDLVARKDGKTIAIEIETGKSDAAANIEKCIAARFCQIWVVFTDKRHKESFVAKCNRGVGHHQFDMRILSVADISD